MRRQWFSLVTAVAATLLTAGTSSAQVGAVFSGFSHPRGFGPNWGGGFFPYSSFGFGSPYGYGSPYGFGSFGYGFGFYGGYSAPTYTYAYVAATPRAAYSPALYAPNAVTSRTALIEVRVPAGAEVWFDGEKATDTGTERTFRSKPLQPDTIYTFEVKASWKENDKPVERTRKVRVMAGDEVRLSLLHPDS
jgi:uncharacterized protein (TIGR03000 family)